MIEQYLLLSIVLFSIGLYGALSRRNIIAIFMCIEIMLNAVNLALVAFSRHITPALVGNTESLEVAAEQAVAARDSGAGLERFERMVIAQGGDARVVAEPGRLGGPVRTRAVEADRSGWLSRLDAMAVGRAVARLGGARSRVDGRIDLLAGIRIRVPVGAEVNVGDCVMELQAANEEVLEAAAVHARAAMAITDEAGVPRPLVLDTIEPQSSTESKS